MMSSTQADSATVSARRQRKKAQKALHNKITQVRRAHGPKLAQSYASRLAAFEAAIGEGAMTLADWIETEWRPQREDITLYPIEEWIARFGRPSDSVDAHGRVNGCCFTTEPDYCE